MNQDQAIFQNLFDSEDNELAGLIEDDTYDDWVDTDVTHDNHDRPPAWILQELEETILSQDE